MPPKSSIDLRQVLYAPQLDRELDLQDSIIVGEGGEGIVYEVDDELVAKIWNLETRKASALRVQLLLQQNVTQDIFEILAWPVSLLQTKKKEVIGYLMNRAHGVPLSTLLNEKTYTHQRMVSVGINLAYVVDYWHTLGNVIKDFNENNILVDYATGNVTLIDLDSYQIATKDAVVPGSVGGVEDSLPPEYKSSSNVSENVWNKSFDNWALAVHLFRILTFDRSPFGSRGYKEYAFTGFTILKRQLGNFLFGRPLLDIFAILVLPRSLLKKFEKTLGKSGVYKAESRITPQQWVDILTRYQQELRSCERNHYFHKSFIVSCPFCAFQKNKSAKPQKGLFNLITALFSPLSKIIYRLLSIVYYSVLKPTLRLKPSILLVIFSMLVLVGYLLVATTKFDESSSVSTPKKNWVEELLSKKKR
jgi:DNA-binding helix-hairpin-helix protein with protein kinase domain